MRIALGDATGCASLEECTKLASETHTLLSNGRYDWPASVLELPDFDAYLATHRTARKRAGRAARRGYEVDPISRADHINEIHDINTSRPERQGRPMSASYLERPTFTMLQDFGCRRHRIDEWGVFTARHRLVGYLVLYVVGELAMISQILGHGDYEADEIMYLLVLESLKRTVKRSGSLTVFYNRHDSGTEGLRFFKERLGFQPTRVEWAL